MSIDKSRTGCAQYIARQLKIQFKVTEVALLTPVKEEIGDDHAKKKSNMITAPKKPTAQPAPTS